MRLRCTAVTAAASCWLIVWTWLSISSWSMLARETLTSTQAPTHAMLPTNLNERFQSLYDFGAPQQWKLAGANWTEYPLTMQDFNRSFTAGMETACGFAQIRQRLDNGEPIKIGVYGGSVSFGSRCAVAIGEPTLHDCAWPKRVQAWFTRQRPQWNITIINYSRGGYGTSRWASETKPDVADAYILEFMINASPQRWTEELLHLLSGPKLVLGSVASCGSDLAWCQMVCTSDTIIHIPGRGIPRRPSYESTTRHGDTYTCPKFWDEASKHSSYLLPKYSIAQFRDLIWWNRTQVTHPDFSHIWNGRVHPESVAHDFMAHFVTYALLRDLYAPVPGCTIPATKHSICANPKTDYDAFHYEQRLKPLNSTGWEFMEDVPYKPGWIATAFPDINNSTVESNLTMLVNVTKSLQITFLESYQGVYPIKLYLPGCSDAIILDPQTGERVSQEKIRKISHLPMHYHHHIRCFNVTQQQPIPITFQAIQGKFKLVRVIGC